ncbi:hypothetical protein C8R45DRAFT_976331 [Mycena sanguinolenta]|nr:hypothetical protein C8R45DRAFT_976331 [Mycena sanguinolenta]
MLTLRGFSAWIVVDGKPVPQYLVAEDTKTSKVSCWIPGEAGQKFTVCWKDHGGKVDSCGFISLDGLVVPGRFLFGNGEASRSGVRSSATTERPFVFQNIEGGEDEPLNQTVNKDAGMITLRIKRIQRVAGRPANPLQELPNSTTGKRKAGDISVGFGEDTQTFDQFAYTWSVRPYEKDGPANGNTPKTFVTFTFRYRTREWLQMQGIMPESDVPPTPPVIRASMRRISSAPAVQVSVPQEATLITPRASPTPPKKRLKTSVDEKPYMAGGRRPRRPSTDMRRTVSFQVPRREFSGEQILVFDALEEEDDSGDADWTP